MPELAQVKAEGKQLAAGIYDWHGELHVDLDELIVASGGDPSSREDVDRAMAQLARVAEAHGIPTEIIES